MSKSKQITPALNSAAIKLPISMIERTNYLATTCHEWRGPRMGENTGYVCIECGAKVEHAKEMNFAPTCNQRRVLYQHTWSPDDTKMLGVLNSDEKNIKEKVLTGIDKLWFRGYTIFTDGSRTEWIKPRDVSHTEKVAYYERNKDVPVADRLEKCHRVIYKKE